MFNPDYLLLVAPTQVENCAFTDKCCICFAFGNKYFFVVCGFV